MRQTGHIFATLDGLRGVAALAVVCLHWALFMHVPKPPAAGLAVDLFFALSGFVLAYNYERRFVEGMTPSTFMRLRAIRLLPLHLFGIAIAALALTLSPPESWTAGQVFGVAALGAALIPLSWLIVTTSPAWIFAANFPAWSLFFELVANAVYAVIYRALSTKVLGALVLISGVTLAGVAALHGSLGGGATIGDAGIGLPRVFFSFFLGVLIARLQGRLPVLKVPPWILMTTLAAMLYGAPGLPYEAFCVFVAFPIMLHLAANTEPTGVSRHVCAVVGAASYAIYVVHIPARMLLVAGLERVGHDPHVSRAEGAVAILVVFLAALALDRWYDGPMRRALLRRARSSEQRGSVPPVAAS